MSGIIWLKTRVIISRTCENNLECITNLDTPSQILKICNLKCTILHVFDLIMYQYMIQYVGALGWHPWPGLTVVVWAVDQCISPWTSLCDDYYMNSWYLHKQPAFWWNMVQYGMCLRHMSLVLWVQLYAVNKYWGVAVLLGTALACNDDFTNLQCYVLEKIKLTVNHNIKFNIWCTNLPK